MAPRTRQPAQQTGAGGQQSRGYTTGGRGSSSPNGGTHPAMHYGSIQTSEGHLAYCVKLIANARAGRTGVQMAFGHLRQQIMKSQKLTPEEKKYLIRRLRRAYRSLSGSFNAQANRSARLAKIRQDADAVVESGQIREKRARRGGWARNIG